MEDLFERCRAVHDHLYGKEQLYHTFAIFLYKVAAQNAKHARPAINKLTCKEDLVVRFANLVSKHIREHRKVQFYAGLLNVTAKHLTETVKEVSGKNAGEVIDDFVIIECKLLPESPAYSVAQISFLMNFADPSFFGKYFKRLTGLSHEGIQNKFTFVIEVLQATDFQTIISEELTFPSNGIVRTFESVKQYAYNTQNGYL